MRGFFKSKPPTPAELVRLLRDLLILVDHHSIRESKRQEKCDSVSREYACWEGRYENTDMALHCGSMLKECIRHQVVANFFAEYNSKLLESSNYITRRQAVKLLGDMLLDRRNSATMTKYVSSRENIRILMNLLRESSKTIQIEGFHVFKLFVANQNKPADIANIIVANKSKLLRLLGDLKTDKEDELLDSDKAQVMQEITSLEPKELA